MLSGDTFNLVTLMGEKFGMEEGILSTN